MSVSLEHRYVLGSSHAEHARLLKQGRALHDCTESLLRDAGISPGQRVLDIGAGMGDVSLLVARLVGDSGAVCGVDQDATALAKARARTKAAGLKNVEFREQDLNHWQPDEAYDAIVGRFVLMFLPAARRVNLLQRLAQALKPGGVAVFQEPSWQDYFANTEHLPLHTRCGLLICDTFSRAGAEINMALPLYQCLMQAGLHAVTVRIEVPAAKAEADSNWTADLFASLYSSMTMNELDLSTLGSNVQRRLTEELIATQSFAPMVGLAGAIGEKSAA